MYIKISTVTPDADFSYIIQKNPNAETPIFERRMDVSTGGRILGKFTEDGGYEVVVYNDGLTFFKEMRARNEAAYVRPEPWIVCPLNLKSIPVAFRAPLLGKPGNDISPERFWAAKHFEVTIGPYHGDNWDEFFLALEIESHVLEEGTSEAKTLILRNIPAMSLTTFLQKVYISMMALTAKWAFFDGISDSKLESYLRLTTDWLGSVPEPFRTIIVNKLTGYHKSLQARFARPEAEPDDQEVPDEAREEAGVKVSLHAKRHALIMDNLPSDAKKIVDLGSGEGKLLTALVGRFPQTSIIGIDAKRERVYRTQRKLRKLRRRGETTPEAVIHHGNLLFPKNWEELVGADALIASEVIEHMRRGDREHFIRFIAEVLEPKVILLTTPNLDANTAVFSMPQGALRHDDHKIEYTPAQFENEVVRPLSKHYDVAYLEIAPGEAVQPSFCIKATRKQDATTSGYMRHVIQRMGESSYFPITDASVTAKNMDDGYTTYSFLDNSRDIFYLGPTIPPVDYVPQLVQYLNDFDAGGPYLEHPLSCFRYYAERGLTLLVEEPKYMGSRAHILVFRDVAAAHDFGFEQPVIMNARSGNRFFNEDTQARQLWEDVAPKMKDDFIILDAEVMPWRLKAKSLIDRDFTLPGEAALLWRQRYQPEAVANTEEYLRMVQLYGADGPFEIRAFHVLARGKVRKGKYRMQFDEPVYGFYRDHVDQLSEIEAIAGDIIKPADCRIVSLNDQDSKTASVKRWMEYCASGGEGFVYKPFTFFRYGAAGYPIQPAMKVRGKDYLRIIYGMDYLEPQYFNRLKRRDTKMKRLLAVQEQEMSMQILRCFINGNETERLRAVGAFLGFEQARATTIDKTL